MVEPITSAAMIGGLIASKDLINKVLGPSADYIGEKGRGLVKKADINLGAIFHVAERKLGKRADIPGAVNPRILQEVWQEGRFCENKIAQEYYGGILAAARSEAGDDRGLTIAKTLSTLSSHQMLMHYGLYMLFLKYFKDGKWNLQIQAEASRMGIFIPYGEKQTSNLGNLCAYPPDSSTFVHATGGLCESPCVRIVVTMLQ